MKEIIEKILLEKANTIIKNGAKAITGGNNGPYHDTETNVRNMAHYTAAFSALYEKTGTPVYLDAVKLLGQAILDSPCYNKKGVYECRKIKENDEVNGVIGPAWIIEGLIWAAKVTKDERFYERARECFLAVPFNESLGIWKRINTKGQILSADATFNHQLWFAAAGAMIDNYRPDEKIYTMLKRFIQRLPKSITIRNDGRIAHFTYNDQNNLLIGAVGRRWRDIQQTMAENSGKPSLKYKETGYHIFNLYGFAILKENYRGNIEFLESRAFKKALDYINSEEYLKALDNADIKMDSTHITTKLKVEFNIFAYAYNSPAFEYTKVAKCFDIYKESVDEHLWKCQMEYTYDEEKSDFSKNTDDSCTLNARLYEYVTAI